MREKVKKIIDSCLSYILDSELKENPEAIILVGSFARGEEVVCQNNGKIIFLSDIEFWTVVKPEEFKNGKHRLNSIRRELEKYIFSNGYDVKVSLGFTTRNHLKRLKPYIFTVETKQFGKVLWGDKRILDYIPDYTEKDIDPLDGFILLNNRIVEQLILLDKIQQRKTIYQYDLNKGYIQIVNSILAFQNRYRSLYPQKREEFLKFFSENKCLNSKISSLRIKIEESFELLEDINSKVLSQEEALKSWQELRDYFKEVRLYELGRLMKKARLLGLKHTVFWFLKALPKFLIYWKAISIYFGDNTDKYIRNSVVRKWEETVK